jgi:tetratricopeptide (TPR) repeat protein
MLGAALDAQDRDRAERLRVDALRAYWNPRRDDNLAARAAFLDRRAAIRPNDPEALVDAGAAHIDLAVLETWTPGAGLAGGAAGFRATPDRVTVEVAQRHLYTGLRYLREARSANPIVPRPHARLGVYAGYFQSSEPAAVHFARAKRLMSVDPDIWYYSGREALARGDEAAAWADWRQSLAVSSRHLGPILRAARDKLSVDEIRTRLMPDDPAIQVDVANVLFPDRVRQASDRRPFLESAAASDRPDLPVDRLMVLADVLSQLGRFDESAAVWRRAVDAAPESESVRNQYARWLEQEERYEEAIEQLDWLRQRQPRSEVIRDRLEAARHGLKLRQEIHGQ